MKESYREDLASHSGLEPYAGGGNSVGVASGRGSAGQALSSEIISFVCRSCSHVEKATPAGPQRGEVLLDTAESENLSMCRHSKCENREDLLVSVRQGGRNTAERSGQKTSQTVQLT
jgi:hypothetical protein